MFNKTVSYADRIAAQEAKTAAALAAFTDAAGLLEAAADAHDAIWDEAQREIAALQSTASAASAGSSTARAKAQRIRDVFA